VEEEGQGCLQQQAGCAAVALGQAAPCPGTTTPSTGGSSHTFCEEPHEFRSLSSQNLDKTGLIYKALDTSSYPKPAEARQG